MDEDTSAQLARLHSYLPKELGDKMRRPSGIERERKEVTVLFADIVGYTAMCERLDPEEVVALTDEVLKELAEAVYQYEGYVDKFIGDEIMAVFGAPITHEDDPDGATGGAVDARADRNARPAGPAASGGPSRSTPEINTGPACRRERRFRSAADVHRQLGDTVNTAARLEEASRPRQILVSNVTHRLTQAAFAFRPLDPIQFRASASR